MKRGSALGIFFRIPQLSKVKKRLAIEIGEDAALKAYESMLRATIKNVSRLKGIIVYGFYEGEITSLNLSLSSDNPPIPTLTPLYPPFLREELKKCKRRFEKEGKFELLKKIPLIPQKGFNLGERMYEAIQWLNQKGYKKVSLIGTDTPDLPISFIKMAFQKLDSYELVIGPSEDGGYYLIGMKKPYKEIFKNIVWGRDRVLKDTISNAINAGISYFLLSEWYDIDDTNTLNRWRLSKKRNWSDNVIKPVLKDCI